MGVLPDLHVLEVLCDALVLLCQLAVLLTVLAVTAAVLALEVEQHVMLARQLALLLVDGGGVLWLMVTARQGTSVQSSI